MQSSIREIRTRLLLLLARAFVIVLFLSFFFFIAVTGYFLASSQNPVDTQIANSLEGYYLGRGSWEGVEAIFELDSILNSLHVLLLDNNHRILLDRKPDSVSPPESSGTSIIGSIYVAQPDDTVVKLIVSTSRKGLNMV